MVHLHDLLIPIRRARLLGSVTLMSFVRLVRLGAVLAGVTGHGSIGSFDFNSIPKDETHRII